jgi:hypothetical protein
MPKARPKSEAQTMDRRIMLRLPESLYDRVYSLALKDPRAVGPQAQTISAFVRRLLADKVAEAK